MMTAQRQRPGVPVARSMPAMGVTRNRQEMEAVRTLRGRYVVLGPLGRSELYEVLHGWDLKEQRNVAIKILRRGPQMDAEKWEQMCSRFEREACYMQLIEHENVVGFYEFFRQDGALHLIMEHLDGITLHRWLRLRRPTAQQLLSIMWQLCKGLEQLHQVGIVHRDIKPENILITQDRRVVLIDLGIAYDMGLGFEACEFGLVRGTPGYLAPEQLTCTPLDESTDVYALGVMMFEMMTNTPLFPGQSLEQVLAAHMNHKIPNYREFCPDKKDKQWRSIAKIAARCLKKKQSKRYANTQELWAALDKTY